MRTGRRFLLWLALTLLLAQQQAVLHALSHQPEPPVAGALQDGDLPHAAACEKCIAFLQLGAAIPSAAHEIPPAVSRNVPAAATLSELAPRFAAAYRSRAPPSRV